MSELETEFPKRVLSKNVDATNEAEAATCKQLGFESHGLVISSPQGEKLWSQADHGVNIADVRVKLKELLLN